MGLQSLEPGYRKAMLCPEFTAFDHFEANCCIPDGRVAMRWERKNRETFYLEVSLPKSVDVQLELPDRQEKFTGEWQGNVTVPRG